ncbi:MAG: periplasmic heavy metal sensor [Caldimicrobium sp.]
MKERVLKVLGLGVLMSGLTFGSILVDGGSKAWGQGGVGLGVGAGSIATQSVNPPSKEAYLKFYQETLPLRQKIWETKEEIRILTLQPNPDWKAIAEKRATLAQLQTELQKKAQEYGIPYGMKKGKPVRPR